MLGKLFKYEWKGFRFPLLVMLIVMLGTTALTCGMILSINPQFDEAFEGYSVFSLVVSIMLYYFGLIGCSLGVILIVAIRFYKTCYSDQGYLTHTLPVSAQKMLNVKIIASFLMVLATTLVMFVTIIVILNVGIDHILAIAAAKNSESAADIADMRREMSRAMALAFDNFKDYMGISLGAYVAYMLVFYLVSLISNIITVLGCVSLGQLYAKHRVIGAIAAYIAVHFIQQILVSFIAILPMYGRMLNTVSYNRKYTAFGMMSPTMNLTLIITIIIGVAMYFINLHMMTKKLNLE
ncbi:MAG: hypothetical protein NC313_03070 [Butyrivibrio sp.]|nr:hypothetical protein [Butyrivibrio sp.]